MFVKCDCSDGAMKRLIYLPDNESYEFRLDYEEGILLNTQYKETQLRDFDYWCGGRKELKLGAVHELYEEIVDEISYLIAMNENIRIIDIEKIEQELIEQKYKKEWQEKGYIIIDEDGRW